MKTTLLLLVLLLANASVSGGVPQPEMERTYDQVISVEKSTAHSGFAARRAALLKVFKSSKAATINGSQIAALNEKEVKYLFDLANTVAFYTFDEHAVDVQLNALRAMRKRDLGSALEDMDSYKALFSIRDFDGAEQFASKIDSKTFPPVPQIEGQGKKKDGKFSEYAVLDDGRRLQLASAQLGDATIIVVVAHPTCHFTQSAVRAISANRKLQSIFAKHSKWIAPQTRDVDFSVYSNWNSNWPSAQMTIAHKASDWTMIDDWATPIFYFIRGGKVVQQIAGWPKEGKEAELLNAARKFGLTDPAK